MRRVKDNTGWWSKLKTAHILSSIGTINIKHKTHRDKISGYDQKNYVAGGRVSVATAYR